jgi:hypothetical protein
MHTTVRTARIAALWGALGLVTLAQAAPNEPPADLLLVDASIETLVPGAPRAAALAVRGDRIVRVGTETEVRALAGPVTRVLDVDGRLVVPGFIEGHGHFMALGDALGVLDLRAERSWESIVAKIAAAARAAKPGEWIRGHGWHQEKWEAVPAGAVEGLPVHAALTAVSPLNPVVLEHASGHGVFVNAAALAAAGIDARTPAPDGGRIVRDAAGNATGWLVDTAMDRVSAALARARAAQPVEVQREALRAAVRRAGAEALSKGVTSFQDAGVSFATLELYRELADRGELPVRIYAMVGGDSIGGETLERLAEGLARHRTIGHANNFLTVRAIKRMADGALGSRSALLLEPYSDDPSSRGLAVDAPETIRRTGELALSNGYQLNTHAIGDRAIRETLDVYSALMAGSDDARGLRWRIEHAQHVHPDEVPRFAALGVIASMQGVHATSDGPWVPKRLGEPRAGERTYIWRTLWDAGAIVTNGSDVPVEDIDPLASFRASVTRRMADGTPFHPEQCLTRMEALVSYTRNNAFAAFEEGLKGTLEPGKLADFVVLSHDILAVAEAELAAARVLRTVLGGRVVYTRESVR